ncbi:multiple cyclophane-containing RiPP AmcA [Micromonospora sp. C95]|uniref:multiple cyclophane-containing RiPP AmcA n=1 Tax=Micromonospora sp. C95 TaxID=2824882 RepID=UPI0026575FDC|nr:multiple cyclophane-containing RiPP AmcA [Micromonospora sp. C95]
MTLYFSRNATVGQTQQLGPDRTSSQRQTWPADPPLLTYVWRRLFGQQVRENDRR